MFQKKKNIKNISLRSNVIKLWVMLLGLLLEHMVVRTAVIDLS